MKPLSSWQRGGSSRAPPHPSTHPRTPPRMWQCPRGWLAAWLLWVTQGTVLCSDPTHLSAPPETAWLWDGAAGGGQFAPHLGLHPLWGARKAACRVYRGEGVPRWGDRGPHCQGDPRCRSRACSRPDRGALAPAAGRFCNGTGLRGWLWASCVSLPLFAQRQPLRWETEDRRGGDSQPVLPPSPSSPPPPFAPSGARAGHAEALARWER